ncbi:MAG: hypothetical protein R6V62_11090 [Candidatus Fermentibacteraceae bacterium]
MKKLFPLLLAYAATASAVMPVLLATDLSNYYPGYVVLPDDTVIYRDTEGQLHSIDPAEPGSHTVIKTDWNPADHGWEFCGQEGLLRANPDGSMLLFTSNLRIPDSLQTSENYVPGPAGVFISGPDGSGTRLVALSMEVGGGPDFQFTRSGDSFYGSPLLQCPATPQGMVEYWLREEETAEFQGYMVDPADGSRSGGPAGFLGDGFTANPWSDLVACGAWPPNLIADAATGGILLELPLSDDTPSGIIEQWVLPDAGLTRDGKGQFLRFADGRTVRNRGIEFTVSGRLADGRYLLSTGYREPLLVAWVDWETFETKVTESYPEIGARMDPMNDAVELPRGGAILFRSSGGLYFAEL